jgi:hypothetical protein
VLVETGVASRVSEVTGTAEGVTTPVPSWEVEEVTAGSAPVSTGVSSSVADDVTAASLLVVVEGLLPSTLLSLLN